MIGFFWSLVVCAAVLMIVSSFMTGVRCDSFTDALKTAGLYAVFSAIAAKLLAIPAVASTAIIGVMSMGLGVPFAILFWGLAICVPSLYLADQIIEGFEIDSVGTTAVVAVVVGLGNFLARVFHIM
jgi:hypothetical protein